MIELVCDIGLTETHPIVKRVILVHEESYRRLHSFDLLMETVQLCILAHTLPLCQSVVLLDRWLACPVFRLLHRRGYSGLLLSLFDGPVSVVMLHRHEI